MSQSSRGMGSFYEATAPRSRSMEERIAQARELVPEEPLPFVVVAAELLRYRGDAVTRESVLARLRATGKTKAQILRRDALGENEGAA